MEGKGNNLEDLFRTISRMQHNCIGAECDRRGIHLVGHPAILFFLRHCSEGMAASQKEIADKLGISTPTVAVSIKRMEKAGIVYKAADETDLRRNLITLTDEGRKMADEAQAAFEDVEKRMFNNLSREECAQLRKLFLRIVANLESIKGSPPEHFGKEKPN